MGRRRQAEEQLNAAVAMFGEVEMQFWPERAGAEVKSTRSGKRE